MFFAGCTSDNVRIVEADAVSDKMLASCGMDRAELRFIQTGHIKLLQAMMIYGDMLPLNDTSALPSLSKSADNSPYHNLSVNPKNADGSDATPFVLTFEPKIKCPITLISSSLKRGSPGDVNLPKLTFQIE